MGSEIHAAGRQSPASRGLAAARFDPLDVSDTEAVERLVRESPDPAVVNFAARTDVDGVERERPPEGPEHAPDSPAFRVNALAPEAIARGARDSGKFLVTISTDFVFDGKDGPYGESVMPAPFSPAVSWYGWTKGEGERRVRATLPGAAILRISYPYRPRFGGKTDFAGWVVDRFRAGALPPLYTDQMLTPTWIPDVSLTIQSLLQSRTGGTFHVASPSRTTPYEFAGRLVEELSGARPALSEGSLRERLAQPGATPRPLNGGLKLGRVPSFGLRLTDWREGVRQVAMAEAGR